MILPERAGNVQTVCQVNGSSARRMGLKRRLRQSLPATPSDPKSVNFFYRLLQAMLFAINFEDITI